MSVRASAHAPLRAWLTVWLVSLILSAGLAPCRAYAAPPTHPAISAPADPCLAGKVATSAPACAQCVCQFTGLPPASAGVPIPRLGDAIFNLARERFFGRLDAPPKPPPRP